MKRYRRKPRVEWVRVNTSTQTTGTSDPAPFFTINYDAAANPITAAVAQFPVIVGDQPLANSSLTEERKDYVIERIVGRFHWELQSKCSSDGTITATAPPFFIKWGFIVCNVHDNGLPLDTSLNPFAIADNDFAEANWMSMETCVAGQNQAYGKREGGLVVAQKWFGLTFPANNQWGAVDRTKIDVASRRRVSENQRLYFVCAMQPTAPNELDYAGAKPGLTGYLDTRVLIKWASKRRGQAGTQR